MVAFELAWSVKKVLDLMKHVTHDFGQREGLILRYNDSLVVSVPRIKRDANAL